VIDFRYHLVSLISVFLALAVGIVLGAGPLRENLGDQLAGQVEQLRTEQEQLRSDSEELAAKNDQLATFISELGPELVQGTLGGKQVAVLTDDTSTRPGIERIMSLLGEAGVESPLRIGLQPLLWAPDGEAERSAALEEIRAIAPAALPADPADELTDTEQLSGLIPALLHDEGELTPELRSQLWQVLSDHQLVSVDGADPAEIDAVIYTGAAPEELAVEAEDEEVATARAQALLAAQTRLLGVLAETGLPAVVSASTPGNDASTGVLRTVRGDRAFDALSTTDRLQEPDGPLLAVLALIEQTRGGSGAYGTTGDAEERLPSLPETRGLEEEITGEGPGGGEAAPQPSDGGGEG
jgi:outer membrane murein-binding lipoprotein Lpp